MKRDMDLARKILLMIEECPEPTFCQPEKNEADREDELDEDQKNKFWVEGYDDDFSSYHVMLLDDAGLITARDEGAMDTVGFDRFPISLTWAGHEFLDASRDPGLWEKAKDFAKEKTGGMSFDVLKSVLTRLAIEAVS